MLVTLCCSLYAPKGDTIRVNNTLDWYDNICESAGVNFGLCLVNDGSPQSFEPIKDKLTPKGYCKDVQYFDSKENEGKAVQLNRLLPVIKTPFVCVIDNDVVLPQNWLEDCMRVTSVPNVGICGVLVEEQLELGAMHVHHTPTGDISFHTPNMMGGACLVWNRHHLGKENYFWSTGEGTYGHEDCEFVQRIHRLVGSVAAIPGRGSHALPDEEDKVGREYLDLKRTLLSSTENILKTRILFLNDTADKVALNASYNPKTFKREQ